MGKKHTLEYSPIIHYVILGQINRLKALLESGTDPDYNGRVSENDDNSHGCTALIYATMYNRSEILKLLLEYKADPNVQEWNTYTALMIAARNDDPELIEILLDHDADPRIKSKYTSNFIDYAHGNEKVSEWLRIPANQDKILSKYPEMFGTYNSYGFLSDDMFQKYKFLYDALNFNLL